MALRAGIPTVQIANMCLDPALLRRLGGWLAEHPAQELVCWADSLAAAAIAGVPGTRAVLHSGAYIVHDSGFYRGISPLDRDRGLPEGEALLPAMRAYARVVSQPEPGLALLDAGKRDVPFDEGSPVPLAVTDSLGGAERPLSATVTALNDQHTFLRWEGESPVAIGDVVTLGLSHPCTAFDKWRLIPVADAEGKVTEAVETFF